MGLFDEVRVKYPLPHPEAQGFLFQTKDTPNPYQQLCEIREDGTLRIQEADRRFVEDADSPFGMYLDRTNERWERIMHEGEFYIYEYDFDTPTATNRPMSWHYKFWFKNGVVADLIAEKCTEGT